MCDCAKLLVLGKTYIYLASPIQEHIAHEPAAHA